MTSKSIFLCSCSSVPIVLVGNKTDLHLERKISTEEGKRLAEKWNAAFVETSAKRNEVYYQHYNIVIHSHKISEKPILTQLLSCRNKVIN